MIPATPGTVAVFRGDGPDGDIEEPVVAWDVDGRPLVVGDDEGLQPASTRAGFLYLSAYAAPSTVIPASHGWWIVDVDGTNRSPVVAWVIDVYGCGFPVRGGIRAMPLSREYGEMVFYDPALGAPTDLVP